MVVPLVKFLSLAVKQVSKPISVRIVSFARNHHTFNRYIINTGQWYHNSSQRLMGRRKKDIKLLDEKVALKEGTSLLVETIVFLIAGSIVLFEYSKSGNKEKDKIDKVEECLDKINNVVEENKYGIESLEKRLKKFERKFFS